jgi:hypothetical protein
MTNKKSNESRRKLLKSIAAGGGAVIAGKSLPENWSRPVVDSVMLPAHAVTSLEQYSSLISAKMENDSLFASAMDGLIPEAEAQPPRRRRGRTAITCITLNPDHSVKVEALITNRNGSAQLTAPLVWIGGEPVEMTLNKCGDFTGFEPTRVKVTDISNGVARGYYITSRRDNKVDFYCPAGACSAPACPIPL